MQLHEERRRFAWERVLRETRVKAQGDGMRSIFIGSLAWIWHCYKDSRSEGEAEEQNTILLPRDKILDVDNGLIFVEKEKYFFIFFHVWGVIFCYPSSLWSVIAVRSRQDILKAVDTNKWELEGKNTEDPTHVSS